MASGLTTQADPPSLPIQGWREGTGAETHAVKTVLLVTNNPVHRKLYEPGLARHFEVEYLPKIKGLAQLERSPRRNSYLARAYVGGGPKVGTTSALSDR